MHIVSEVLPDLPELITPLDVYCDESLGEQVTFSDDRMIFSDGSTVRWRRAVLTAESDNEGLGIEGYLMYTPDGALIPDLDRDRWCVTDDLLWALINQACEQDRPELLPAVYLLELTRGAASPDTKKNQSAISP